MVLYKNKIYVQQIFEIPCKSKQIHKIMIKQSQTLENYSTHYIKSNKYEDLKYLYANSEPYVYDQLGVGGT